MNTRFHPFSSMKTLVFICLFAAAILLGLIGCGGNGSSGQNETESEGDKSNDLDTVQSVVSSEELILALTPKLKWLSHGMMNLQFPDQRGKKLFANTVLVTGLGPLSEAESLVSNLSSLVDRTWQVQSTTKVTREQLDIWTNFLSEVDYFEHAKIYFVDGQLAPETVTTFDANMGFAGLARMKDGVLRSIAAKLFVQWVKEPDGPDPNCNDWQIVEWNVKNFHAIESKRLLFEDVIARAIPDPIVRRQATRSLHHEFFVDSYKKYVNKEINDIREPYDYDIFFPDVTFEHPGLSVIDFDQDGWDDLYVCMQRGKNLLFRNNGDGTLTEMAAAVGLDIKGGSTCAAFADFDNDGDPDLLLGRGRKRAMYFVNQDGTYIDRTAELVDTELPFLCSSIAVADYNGDGLLDVLIGTYCPIEGGQGAAQSANPTWVDAFMNAEQQAELELRVRQAHKILNMVGPPNVLLKNLGKGRFGLSEFNSQLESWKRCFQVAWSDFDSDGDPDAYLSNDYAPDQLFRNDGTEGFVDITGSMNLDTLGFGMGVSWADYDNDGRLDLYASNMYSKAGNRITQQIPDLDKRFFAMAQGNYLYRFDGDQFVLKSGYPGEALHVSKAGWSWGGQFADFNNDTFQDIYVTSGYHTAPPEFAVDMDL